MSSLNWRVLSITVFLSMLCGVLFGLAPAIQSTRPALVPALKDSGDGQLLRRSGRWMPRLSLQKALVVGQISLLMLLLIAAGLFVQTVSNLHSVALGFNQENVLLFELNAPQAGRPPATVAAFYDDLRKRFAEIPGVRAVTLSHSSLLRAGRGHPVRVDGVIAEGTRFMQTGPGFFSTMQIPMLQGREIDERDGAGSLPVAVISDAIRADVHAEPESDWAGTSRSAAALARSAHSISRSSVSPPRPNTAPSSRRSRRSSTSLPATAAELQVQQMTYALSGPTAIRCATPTPSGRSSTAPIRACR